MACCIISHLRQCQPHVSGGLSMRTARESYDDLATARDACAIIESRPERQERRMKRCRLLIAGLTALLVGASPVCAQGTDGTVQGRITDAATQQPIAGATVTAGRRTALTQVDGHYSLTIPAGTYMLEARTIGYGPGRQSVTVVAGQTVTVDLALTAQAVNLAAVVVTGYGQQRAGDITGAVSQLTPAEFNPGRIVSPQSMITSKVA